MATVISDTFKIVIDLAAGQTTTNLDRYIDANRPRGLRGMRIVQIWGTGLDTAVLTLNKVTVGGGVTAVGVVTMAAATNADLVDQPGVMGIVAAQLIQGGPNGNTLQLVRSVANSTRLVLDCIAVTGETIVES
jgi:hypothetical protein